MRSRSLLVTNACICLEDLLQGRLGSSKGLGPWVLQRRLGSRLAPAEKAVCHAIASAIQLAALSADVIVTLVMDLFVHGSVEYVGELCDWCQVCIAELHA